MNVDILNAVSRSIRAGDAGAGSDVVPILTEYAKSDKHGAIAWGRRCADAFRSSMPYAYAKDLRQLNDSYNSTLRWLSPHDFDSYMLFLESGRECEKQFYLPRRAVLGKLANSLQRLTDGDLEELILSQPPRTGKTTMLMFYSTWLVGRDSERSNLYSAYSDVITSAFYNGCLEVITDPTTYRWNEVFPEAKLVDTNAKDEAFNIDRNKRYRSMTCRSLYGTLNGACDCDGVLISDDLIGGIEEALNKDRLMAAWSKVDNNLLPRAKEKAKILWCGTRWSLLDPAGMRISLLQNDPAFKNRKYEIINLPALDENGESNFEYRFGVGFSTKHYEQRRASFEHNNDMASWLAQFMGEPIERSGTLFDPSEMRFYNGVLPDESKIVRKFMAVDPAFGGGDFTASPVCYQYEDGSVYVVDVVYDSGEKTVTQPLIASMVADHGINAIQFEANKTTKSYKEGVESILNDRGIKVNITSKPADTRTAKEIRIFDKAPEIREFYFLESGKRSKAYSAFMQNVFSFTMTGRNTHDDAPDSLAMAVTMLRDTKKRVEIIERPF